MMFNSTIQSCKASSQTFHTTKQVSPIAAYLQQLLHSKTTKMDLIWKVSHISPDCLLDISIKMGIRAIEAFEKEDPVYPLNTRHNLSTTAGTDNLYENSSFSTATSAFHGAATSLDQYIFSDNFGRFCNIPDALRSGIVLTEEVTKVKPGYLPSKVPTCELD